jgi:hypothetical protein
VHRDKELGPFVGEGLDGVCVPHLVEKVLRHDDRFCWLERTDRKAFLPGFSTRKVFIGKCPWH